MRCRTSHNASEVVSRGYTHLSADDTMDAISKLPDVTTLQTPTAPGKKLNPDMDTKTKD
jgi:hypothetical protein